MERYCCVCNKKERKSLLGLISNMNTCGWCNRTCCSDCTKKTGVSAERDLLRFFSEKYYAKRLCLHCYELYMRDYNKMHKALYSRTEVRYFSKNYQGKISTTGEHFGIGTRYYTNRDIAMEELKILARYLDCDAIIEGDFDWQEKEEETENENGRISRYRYKVWAYAGVAVRLVNKKNKI